MRLAPAEAAIMYRDKRMSACQIATAAGITRQGAEYRIRAAGLGGLTWCPLCRKYETLTLENAEAVSLPAARARVPAPRQPQSAPAAQGALV